MRIELFILLLAVAFLLMIYKRKSMDKDLKRDL